MSYLLIWNGFENGIQYYLIPKDSPGVEDLRLVHQNILGCENDSSTDNALSRVSDRISKEIEWCENKEIGTSWHQHKVDLEKPFTWDGPLTIVETGCVP